MADTNTETRPDQTVRPGDVTVVTRRSAEGKEISKYEYPTAAPHGVPQEEFPSTMKPGVHGMINRMVDYNAVTRTAQDAPIGVGCAVTQSTAEDGGALAGGAVNSFVGITILDPTIVQPTTAAALPPNTYPQYASMGVLTKGEIFIQQDTVATLPGEPVFYDIASGVLSNAGGAGPIPGARWKYNRPAGGLNVVQLGIQT
jgi:hypothetical protein